MTRIYFLLFFVLMFNASLKSSDGTALHAACCSGNLDIVRLLMASKADANIKDREGNTPVLIACLYGYAEVVDFFLEQESMGKVKLNLSDINDERDTLLHLACNNLKGEDAKKIVKKITSYQHISINAFNKQDDNPLYIACNSNNVEAVKILLSNDFIP